MNKEETGINRKIKFLIREFLDDCPPNFSKEISNGNLYDVGVHVIDIYHHDDYVEFFIYVQRPGFLIGKGGERITNLKTHLEKKLMKTVNIIVSEYDPFFNDNNILSELEHAISESQ